MYKEIYDIVLKNKNFKGDILNGVQSNALGFMWRPGQNKQSILIENCKLDANGVASIMFSYTADLAVLTGNIS